MDIYGWHHIARQLLGSNVFQFFLCYALAILGRIVEAQIVASIDCLHHTGDIQNPFVLGEHTLYLSQFNTETIQLDHIVFATVELQRTILLISHHVTCLEHELSWGERTINKFLSSQLGGVVIAYGC